MGKALLRRRAARQRGCAAARALSRDGLRCPRSTLVVVALALLPKPGRIAAAPGVDGAGLAARNDAHHRPLPLLARAVPLRACAMGQGLAQIVVDGPHGKAWDRARPHRWPAADLVENSLGPDSGAITHGQDARHDHPDCAGLSRFG